MSENIGNLDIIHGREQNKCSMNDFLNSPHETKSI